MGSEPSVSLSFLQSSFGDPDIGSHSRWPLPGRLPQRHGNCILKLGTAHPQKGPCSLADAGVATVLRILALGPLRLEPSIWQGCRKTSRRACLASPLNVGLAKQWWSEKMLEAHSIGTTTLSNFFLLDPRLVPLQTLNPRSPKSKSVYRHEHLHDVGELLGLKA